MASQDTLALKYRPRKFSDVVGQRVPTTVLKAMVVKDKVPTGLLFAGVPGTGKTTMGRILSASLNCEAEQKPCGECAHCKSIFDGSSMDVLEIDAASHGNVADVRQVIDLVQYQVGARKRVVMFDEAHSMSTEAFNVLLKTLEEPPEDTVFILLTTEPHRIIDTVLSRLMSFEFTRISAADISGRLKFICAEEGLSSVDPALLDVIAERSQGGLRSAIMTLDQLSRVGVTTVAEFREWTGVSDFAPSVLAAMTYGKIGVVFSLVDSQLSRIGDPGLVVSQLVSCLKDVMLLHAGCTISATGKALNSRRLLLEYIPHARAVTAMGQLWKLRTVVRTEDSSSAARSSLDLALVMMLEALKDQRREEPAPAQDQEAGPKPGLTAAQISALLNGGTEVN